MQITITATGHPKNAIASVREQVRLLRQTPHPESAALLSAVGDELTRRIESSSEPVNITLELTITEVQQVDTTNTLDPDRDEARIATAAISRIDEKPMPRVGEAPVGGEVIDLSRRTIAPAVAGAANVTATESTPPTAPAASPSIAKK